MSKPTVLLIYTGGTIGMMKDFSTGALKAFDFDQLLDKIPELHLLDCEIATYSFETPIDSSNMNPQQWIRIAAVIEENYEKYDAFVVLHGSDTMSYSASALSFMLENLSKPVIFTGSQLPIGDLRTDAKENLITAIQVATLRDGDCSVLQEVALYFEYKLYRGNRSSKINAEHFNAFASPNYPCLAESGVHLKVGNDYLLKADRNKSLIVRTSINEDVAIIKLFPGINAKIFGGILSIPGLKGVVLETYGSGNAPTETWFTDALKDAIARGIHIVNVTQCSGGSVNMGRYETSTLLKELGIISGNDITTEAAITKLMYLLGQHIPQNEFKNVFETALRGEISL